MKILIAIKSCARDTTNGFNDAVRKTWLRNLKIATYCFVLGKPAKRRHLDELVLDCGDDYLNLPFKTKSILKWSVAHDFDYTFLCDTDTYVVPDRLLSSPFYKYDYVGFFNGRLGVPNEVYSRCYSWASGGSGYWLSRRAAKFVSQADVYPKSLCPELKISCEDLWIGQVLGEKIQKGVYKALHDPRYGRSYRDDYKTDITSHYCSQGANRKFNTDWMFKHHQVNGWGW